MDRFEGGCCWFFGRADGVVVYYGKYSFPAKEMPSYCIWLVPGYEG
jgi:hypothetical protein